RGPVYTTGPSSFLEHQCSYSCKGHISSRLSSSSLLSCRCQFRTLQERGVKSLEGDFPTTAVAKADDLTQVPSRLGSKAVGARCDAFLTKQDHSKCLERLPGNLLGPFLDHLSVDRRARFEQADLTAGLAVDAPDRTGVGDQLRRLRVGGDASLENLMDAAPAPLIPCGVQLHGWIEPDDGMEPATTVPKLCVLEDGVTVEDRPDPKEKCLGRIRRRKPGVDLENVGVQVDNEAPQARHALTRHLDV